MSFPLYNPAMGTTSRLLMLLAAALVSPGCSRAGRIEAENDRLREEALQLQGEIESLNRQNAELEARLDAVAATRPQGEADPEVLASTPYVVELAIGRLSHVRDQDGDGRPDLLVVYLEPRDGRGRFVQMVGHVAVVVAVLPADGPAQTIGQTRFSPSHLRDAYRSAFTGTHYTLEVPIMIPADTPADSQQPPNCTVKVIFDDALSGKTTTAERPIGLTLSSNAS